MEAVPRLYMLCFDLKASQANSDFATPLKKYIRSHYQEDPEAYQKEIKDIESLRQAACRVAQDFTGCSTLKRYFSQLILLQNRFPMTDDGPACVPFTWTDIYSGATFTITDIKYEQACILYNIGALHSQLGALDSRSNAEGMKMTCTHFQCAAWAFQHLLDTYPQPKGSDLSHSILSFMVNVMLAQAQECILEKSMLDNRKSSITAKVAIQVVDYYRASLTILVSNSPSKCSIFDVVGIKLFKTWKKYIEFKMAYYTSISHYFMGNQCEEQQKMGERVSWYQSASEYLNEAIKIAKTMDREELNESLLFLLDVIGGKHSAAKKENDFVYHEKVVPTDSLQEIRGASLVKGIPFSPTDPDVCGVDIFARLVPMEAHSSSSVYSEEKAKILRSVGAKIEERNEELSTYLSSLHLDQSILNENDEHEFPEELMKACAALSVKPTAVPDLCQFIKDLTDISSKVETDLNSCRSLLSSEKQKEAEHEKIFGKRAPSMILLDLEKECSQLEKAYKKAADSNKLIQNVVSSHVDNLKMLSGPVTVVKNSLPSVSKVKANIEGTALEDYRKLLNKVEEMQKQRQYLESQLREALQKDDITKRIVATDSKADIQKIFEEELKKHEQSLTYIEQNLAAQDNILHALTEANAKFADVRKSLVAAKQEREVAINSLIASYEAYEDLTNKVKEGLEFYEKLKGSVSRLLDRLKSVTRVQEEERMQRIGAQKRTGVPTVLPSQSMEKPSSAPKLKDYLPFMTNQKLPASSIAPNSQSLPVSYQLPSGIPPTQPVVDRSMKTSHVYPASLPVNNGTKLEANPHVADKNIYAPSAEFTTSALPSGSTTIPSGHSLAFSATPVTTQHHPQPSVSSVLGYPGQSQSFTGYSSGNVPSSSTYDIPVCKMNNSASVVGVSSTLPTSVMQSTTTTSSVPYSVPVQYTNSYTMYSTGNLQYTGYLGNSGVALAHSTLSPISATTIATIPNTPISGGYPASQTSANMYANADNMPSVHAGSQSVPSVHSGPQSMPGVSPSSHSAANIYPVSQATTNYPNFQFVSNPYMSSQPTANAYPNAQPTTNIYPVSQPTTNVCTSSQPSVHAYVSLPPTTNVYASSQPPVNAYPSSMPTTSTYLGSVPTTNTYLGSQPATFFYPNSQPIANAYRNSQPTANAYRNSQPTANAYRNSQPAANAYPSSQPAAVSYPSSQPIANAYPSSQPVANTYQSLQPVTSAYISSQPGTNVYQNSNVFPNSVKSETGVSEQLEAQAYSYPYDYNASAAISTQTSLVKSFPASSGIPNASSYTPVTCMQTHITPSTQIFPVHQKDGTLYTRALPQAVTSISSPSSHPEHSAVLKPVSSSETKLLLQSKSTSLHELQPLTPTPAVNEGTKEVVDGASVDSRQNSAASLTNGREEMPKQSLNSSRSGSALSDSVDTNGLTKQVPKNNQELEIQNVLKSKGKDQQSQKDPLDEPAVLARFTAEVEKFEKLVEGLVRKSLNGTMPLDQKWKDLAIAEEKDSRKMAISIARCYPLKNRIPDIMPYDSNRVILLTCKNDYINASYLKDLLPSCPTFVITQTPLPTTYSDFWMMVWEQQVENIVCLLSLNELKNHVYWPQERGKPILHGLLELSLQTQKGSSTYTERIINITHTKQKTSRVVVHLQFNVWQPSKLPDVDDLLQFVSFVLSYHKQQRSLQRPLVVHCSSGVGRSGAFCLISAYAAEMNSGQGPRDVIQVAARMFQQRKFIIHDKDHLKYCYHAVLSYAQKLLQKRGIFLNRSSFDDKTLSSVVTSQESSEEVGLVEKIQSSLNSISLDQSVSSHSSRSSVTITPGPVQNLESSEEKTNVLNEAGEVGHRKSHDTSDNGECKSEDNLNVEDNDTHVLTEKQTPVDTNDLTDTSEEDALNHKDDSVMSVLDPSKFTLDSSSGGSKRRITKDMFASRTGQINRLKMDSLDPLSELDPMWSLKK